MNTVNRVVIVVLLAVLAILCCVLSIGAKWIAPAIAEQLSVLAGSLGGMSPVTAVVVGAGIGLASVFVLTCLIILEVRPIKRKFIRVEKAAGGEVEVSVTSIVNRLKHEINALPGVLGVKPSVSGSRGGVVIHLQVDIAAGLDLPVQADQIVEAARKVVEEKMGLKMPRKPKVSLRTVPYPKEEQPKQPAEAQKRPPAESGESLPTLLDDED
jgi:hypothetical protein